MARLHGGSRRGERCVGTVPHGHWASSTFIAALRLERIDAPFLIEGSANVEVFDAYVDQVLRPELRPVDRAILDNLCINKTPRVIRRINARGGPSASCRPTAPTSTRSRWPSPN